MYILYIQQQFFLVLLADKSVDIRVQQNSNSHFTFCITPLAEVAIFLTARVMVDAQIHYNLKNNTVLCQGV